MEKRSGTIVGAFFVALLSLGLTVFGDYGVSWDEPNSRENGIKTVSYALSGGRSPLDHVEKYHGPAYELTLALAEKALGLTDSRDVYRMRHLANFLLFLAGVAAFYRLGSKAFRSWRLGLLGSAFLVLSPRIFADAFYNSKDIPCLVLFIVGMLTMIRFLERRSAGRAAAHAAACALLIDVRIMGVLLPVMTLAFLALDCAAEGEAPGRAEARAIAVYLPAMAALTVLFWPLLWSDPSRRFLEAFSQHKNYDWPSSVLYLGRYIRASGLPWHYIPLWLLISTPLLYAVLFAAGTISVLWGAREGPRRFYRENRSELIFAVWLLAPLAGLFLFRPTVYDGWRHFFFIYPAFLLIALRGVQALGRRRVLGAALGLGLLQVAWTMIRLHPYQNLYFNRLAGRTMPEIKDRFELDYWGLSYRRAFEHILRQDQRPVINVILAAYPSGLASLNLLSVEDRRRLAFPTEPGTPPDYFLSNYRWHKEDYPYGEPYYSIEIDGARVLVVYKRP